MRHYSDYWISVNVSFVRSVQLSHTDDARHG